MTRIIDEVKKLQLPLGQYSVVGEGALSVRGIRDYQDIDLIVAEPLYEKLKNEGWKEREKSPGFAHLYKANAEIAKSFLHIKGCNLRTDDVIRNSEIIEGVPFMALNDLIELKKTLGRDKDENDIQLIMNYMKNN